MMPSSLDLCQRIGPGHHVFSVPIPTVWSHDWFPETRRESMSYRMHTLYTVPSV